MLYIKDVTMAHEVTVQTFQSEVLDSKLPVVVDFYASWCGPCRQMAPHFDALSVEMAATHKLVKVNVDNERELAIKLGITSMPTLLFFKNGSIVAKEVGGMGKETLRQKIEGHLK